MLGALVWSSVKKGKLFVRAEGHAAVADFLRNWAAPAPASEAGGPSE